MIRGSCNCGCVKFQFMRAVGPFELCHCSRCRKASGSAFVSGLLVKREDFRLMQGREMIKTYEAPVREAPPAYCTSFCGRCGSPVPNPFGESPCLEIPAGLLDDDPGMRPERPIFVDVKSAWFNISDDLPQLDRAALLKMRKAQLPR